MKFAARHSALIFTISEFTRQDVIRLLKVKPSRAFNIYGAASDQYKRIEDPSRLEAVRQKYSLPEPLFFTQQAFLPEKTFHACWKPLKTFWGKSHITYILQVKPVGIQKDWTINWNACPPASTEWDKFPSKIWRQSIH